MTYMTSCQNYVQEKSCANGYLLVNSEKFFKNPTDMGGMIIFVPRYVMIFNVW